MVSCWMLCYVKASEWIFLVQMFLAGEWNWLGPGVNSLLAWQTGVPGATVVWNLKKIRVLSMNKSKGYKKLGGSMKLENRLATGESRNSAWVQPLISHWESAGAEPSGNSARPILQKPKENLTQDMWFILKL